VADAKATEIYATAYNQTYKQRRHRRPPQPFWAPRSAVPSLHVVPDIGHLSAPCVMVALAGIVHDREAAAGHEHNRAEDDQQGGLHVDDLRCCGPLA
jgi:hypothetical protein